MLTLSVNEAWEVVPARTHTQTRTHMYLHTNTQTESAIGRVFLLLSSSKNKYPGRRGNSLTQANTANYTKRGLECTKYGSREDAAGAQGSR